MSKIHKTIIIISSMLLILILMFPPYTGIRIAQSDNHRIFLGYHSLFFPPRRAYISSSFDNHKKSISSYNKNLYLYNSVIESCRLTIQISILIIITIALLLITAKSIKPRIVLIHYNKNT